MATAVAAATTPMSSPAVAEDQPRESCWSYWWLLKYILRHLHDLRMDAVTKAGTGSRLRVPEGFRACLGCLAGALRVLEGLG